MNRFLARGLAACAVLALAGCSDASLTVVCPPGPTPSVLLTVLDGPTSQSMGALAAGTWSVAGISDSLRHVNAGGTSRLAAFGPAGAYTVLVQSEGFGNWRAEGVIVPGDECGPGMATLTATLYRSPDGGDIDND